MITQPSSLGKLLEAKLDFVFEENMRENRAELAFLFQCLPPMPPRSRREKLKDRVRLWRQRLGFWIAGYDPADDY